MPSPRDRSPRGSKRGKPSEPEAVTTPNPEPPPRAGVTVRASRILDASASAVFRALNDPTRRGWSPEPLYRVLSALAPRFVRLALPDGSQVSVAITRQGNVRCSVAIEHSGLPADSQPIAVRQRWMAALAALAEQLDTDLD